MTPRTRQWIRQDGNVAVWTFTRVELLSALARRRRERLAAPDVLAATRRELLAAWEQWSEIAAIDLVRPRAERLVERHPLRAADALQIGAALVAADGREIEALAPAHPADDGRAGVDPDPDA